jgi:[ribosomal protein S18]-alanine N-acetyltransferase
MPELLAAYGDSTFAGPGVTRLEKAASAIGRDLKYATPSTYAGGDLARIFARDFTLWSRLDPTGFDVNYLLKSQPEQRRDAAAADSSRVVEMNYSDLDEVLRIERESFSDPWDRDAFRSDIESPHVIALVIRRDSQCAGYVSCIALDDYGYIANIAVDKRYWASGIGRSLLDELKRRLLAKGTDQMVLDVRASNERAIRFYEKYGFGVITRRKKFYTSPPEDSFTMQMTIGE